MTSQVHDLKRARGQKQYRAVRAEMEEKTCDFRNLLATALEQTAARVRRCEGIETHYKLLRKLLPVYHEGFPL